MDRDPRTSGSSHERSEARRPVFATGALLAAAGVLLGAFGAHALAHLPAKALGWWQTATQYLFVSAFAIMLAGLAEPRRSCWRSPAVVLVAGALLFSGSLYAMALGAPTALGMVTPVGGVALVAGFVWLAITAWRGPRGNRTSSD